MNQDVRIAGVGMIPLVFAGAVAGLVRVFVA